jgi:hypothetical protein
MRFKSIFLSEFFAFCQNIALGGIFVLIKKLLPDFVVFIAPSMAE